MGESLKELLSNPLEGAGDGDRVGQSDSHSCNIGDPPFNNSKFDEAPSLSMMFFKVKTPSLQNRYNTF